MPRYVHPRLDPNERFRERRRQAVRRRRRRRLAAVTVLLGLGAGSGSARRRSTADTPPRPRLPRAAPIRVDKGRDAAAPTRAEVHGLPRDDGPRRARGQDRRLRRAEGLRAEHDRGGRQGRERQDRLRLAGAAEAGPEIGAAQPFYDAETVVEKVHAAGIYLIGRVVVFEDPTLSAARPDLARPPAGRLALAERTAASAG